MGKLAAITNFEKDFEGFQVANLALLSSLASALEPALKESRLDDYFMNRVDDLREDLVETASEDLAPGDRGAHASAAIACDAWIESHLRDLGDLAFLALVLWMDGPADGRAALFKAAKIQDPNKTTI